LDLLQIWGSYLKAQKSDAGLDLLVYLAGQIGIKGAAGGLGWADVVADADAYMVSRAMKESGSSMSGALRGLLKLTSAQRVSKFYQDRFGASEMNVITAFAKLADGIDVGPVNNFPWNEGILLQAANAARLPTPEEARVCGQAYARMMASQG
jgi:hypothetical protein